ncbi:MAG: sugar phosphate isomerase/epimerase [Granulosicoccus sp.]|nr:sugar phosphate isomerase/epimerase [Granulosicoccus sp.]
MNYSFQLYSARNFTPWKEAYKTIANAGYKEVEGFGGVYTDAMATRALLDEAGLSMPSGHFSIDALENQLSDSLKTASDLGFKTIYCPYLEQEDRPSNAADWKAFGKRLSDVGKRVNEGGFRFGWHNHDFEFIACDDGSIPMRSILNAAPDIEWEIDVAWIVRAGSDPSTWIDEYGSRISAVHIKDIAANDENQDEDGWADIGHGTLNWESLLQQLSLNTKATVFAAEHDNPSDLARFAKRSIASLNSFT